MGTKHDNTAKERKLIAIMACHLLAVWALSIFSFSGTAAGNAVGAFFILSPVQ